MKKVYIIRKLVIFMKWILFFIAVGFLIVVLYFGFYFIFYNDDSNVGGSVVERGGFDDSSEKFLPELPEGVDIGDSVNGRETSRIDDSGSGSGGSSGRGSGGSSGGITGRVGEDFYVGPFCSLVQPENVVVDCFLNYVNENGVSLKIGNNAGQDMKIFIRIAVCGSGISDSLFIGEEKDFVFSCDVRDYFQGDLFITYKVGEEEPVTIFGVVGGSVK